MVVKKTKERVDITRSKSEGRIYIQRFANASSSVIKWNNKKEIGYSKYQIKESDMRQKTASFTTNQPIDLTTGLYAVLITSPTHENFGGVILDYDREENGKYTYQCQDFTRKYQSKVDLICKKINYHRILKYLITKGYISLKGNITEKQARARKVLSGLYKASVYNQSYWGSSAKFNPMTMKNNLIIRNKSYIEAIRSLMYGSGAYVDVYTNIYGVIQIEPYDKNKWLNNGITIPKEEIKKYTLKFDTTNIITDVVVNSTDDTKMGKVYSSKQLTGFDLASIFGNVGASISNPNQAKTKTTKTKTTNKTSTTKVSSDNPYGTKSKTVYLNSDLIQGYSYDSKQMDEMIKILKKYGWKCKNCGVGSEAHYQKRGEVKNGIWFTIYGGACAGTLREQASNSWYRTPLVNNGSRSIVGFFPPSGDIRKGGKYYKYLPPAHDWQGSQSYARINYPAKYLTDCAIPFMYAKNPKEMVAKFLKGGDNPEACKKNWKFKSK